MGLTQKVTLVNFKSGTHTRARLQKSQINPFSWTWETLSSILGHNNQVVIISLFPFKNQKQFFA